MEHMRNVVITSKEHFLLLFSALLFFDVNTEKSNAKRDGDSPLCSSHELFRCSESGWLRMKTLFQAGSAEFHEMTNIWRWRESERARLLHYINVMQAERP